MPPPAAPTPPSLAAESCGDSCCGRRRSAPLAAAQALFNRTTSQCSYVKELARGKKLLEKGRELTLRRGELGRSHKCVWALQGCPETCQKERSAAAHSPTARAKSSKSKQNHWNNVGCDCSRVHPDHGCHACSAGREGAARGTGESSLSDGGPM